MTTPSEEQPQAPDTGAEPIDLSEYGNDSLYELFQRGATHGEGQATIIRTAGEHRDE